MQSKVTEPIIKEFIRKSPNELKWTSICSFLALPLATSSVIQGYFRFSAKEDYGTYLFFLIVIFIPLFWMIGLGMRAYFFWPNYYCFSENGIYFGSASGQLRQRINRDEIANILLIEKNRRYSHPALQPRALVIETKAGVNIKIVGGFRCYEEFKEYLKHWYGQNFELVS